MNYQAILEMQSLFEKGKLTLAQIVRRLDLADVCNVYVDWVSRRVIYEDAEGGEINLPIVLHETSFKENFLKKISKEGLSSMTIYLKEREIVCVTVLGETFKEGLRSIIK